MVCVSRQLKHGHQTSDRTFSTPIYIIHANKKRNRDKLPQTIVNSHAMIFFPLHFMGQKTRGFQRRLIDYCNSLLTGLHCHQSLNFRGYKTVQPVLFVHPRMYIPHQCSLSSTGSYFVQNCLFDFCSHRVLCKALTAF